MTSQEILNKYWNYTAFRTPQEEIINAVLEQNDSFAIMPTGGGKSICFQVPAMMQDGICLVISPLIALMKDQIAQLNHRNIKAIALTGGKSIDEISDLLDNCQFGNYKFLYLSPERLQTDWIFDRIKNLPINLIAIDEAHCVSQWGHDFRPAYLKISKLKEAFPQIPFLALTASATETVKNDVIEQLKLDKPSVFQKSFARENIAYMVFETEDKLYKVEQILKKNPQSAIIYVRNRKACSDIASNLKSLGITATYYNGGLSMKEKDKNMQLWMSDQVQVMVATNAFGMGIDKPTVKTVIHINLPENIENYYQEAGRAGRNGDKAFAVLLTNPSDILRAEKQFLSVLPDKQFLKELFIKLCNYFRIGYGEGLDEQFQFNLNQFCLKYNYDVLKTYNAIQFLDRQGIVTLSQEFSEKILIHFIIESKEVIRYMSLNPQDEAIILTILRLYPGIYEYNTAINLPLLSKKANTTEKQILTLLDKLKTKQIIDYQAKSNDATIVFNEIREDDLTINRVSKFLVAQNKLKTEQFNSVLSYIKNDENCKSNQILAYFGEKSSKNCGICSFCITQNKKIIEADKTLKEKIIALLSIQEMNSREIEKLTKKNTNEVILAIKDLLEKNQIQIKSNNKYRLKK
jgi:ATP-dependent DNA helicase RecQ